MSTNTIEEHLFMKLDEAINVRQLYLRPDLSRDDLCRLMGVGKNRIGAIIQQCSGAPNSQVYINRKRIEYSKELIKQYPDYTVEAICMECGMSNPSTFYRLFKKFVGVTPVEYKNSLYK